ncbi:LIC12192 family sporadic carbohydrate cluster protein [Paramagnetospirillum magneticum]|uniref:Sporadic carbohydrate cluster protein, LIC12192 family n=1 Tax=Paramagnetospirillum magneticum (strain ATCC 700264 / AMB-1) TaxID=342108 RepID=Q2WBA2_PARM1|nr:LIC12192 family sporadic carbohydrate cluster protein [Paramagnetospirillum magneticum]BAE48873.1 hypothetical protein amb0069 [Paramagnetospirillum magneticum AMB-1]
MAYRGYIASRPVMGERTPQHVQNLVVRDYARRRGLTFALSATEYAMPGCYMILEQVLDEMPRLDGIICFSLFMLPHDVSRRAETWRRVRAAGGSLHFAVEGLAVQCDQEFDRVEDIWTARTVMKESEWQPSTVR